MKLICKCGMEITNNQIKVGFEKSLCSGYYSEIHAPCEVCDDTFHLKLYPQEKPLNIDQAKDALVRYYDGLTIKNAEV